MQRGNTQRRRRNENIVCLASFNHFCHISVCKVDIRSTDTIDICSYLVKLRSGIETSEICIL